MTLIAGFFKDECPILMGDLLVSDDDKSDNEFVFPTVGSVSKRDLSNGEYSPSKLSQKVILVSPKLAICWAGTKIYATAFIKEVIKANLHQTPSYESLDKVYNDIDGYGNISIIGLYRDGTEMRIFDFNSYPVESSDKGFKYFKAAGTGYASLLEITPELEKAVTHGNLNKLEKGITLSMAVTASLLSKEVLTFSSLKNLFGAGYEIVYPLGSDLVKFKDLTYIFWQTEEEKKGSWKLLRYPFLASNYSYHKDFLVIRTVRISSSKKTNSCKLDSDELHFVSPIHKTLNMEELIGYSPNSFNSKFICNIFLWKNLHGEIGAYVGGGFYGSGTPPVIWTDEFKKNKGININNDFLKTSMTKVILQATSGLEGNK
jgi:hypothetical protein